MIYIPEDWLREKGHTEQVYALLKPLDSDLFFRDKSTEDVICKLEEMKEDIIIEKIQNGSIPFGA